MHEPLGSLGRAANAPWDRDQQALEGAQSKVGCRRPAKQSETTKCGFSLGKRDQQTGLVEM